MTATIEAPTSSSPEPTQEPAASSALSPSSAQQRTLGPLVGDVLLMIFLMSLWFVVTLLVLGNLSQSRAQTELYQELRTNLAAATAPLGGAIAPGTPVALLTMPGGDELVVSEGTASGDLLSGPGHRRDTPLPGQQGVSLIYGRAVTYGAPFGDITDLQPGDVITATTQQGEARFIVDGVRHSGDTLPQPLAEKEARLTLVTAENDGGPLSAVSVGRAVYVDATLAGKPFVAPVGRPAWVPAPEQALAGDPGGLPLLGVYLAALLAAMALALVLGRQYSRVLVWILFSPILIALAWMTTNVMVQLAPNLL